MNSDCFKFFLLMHICFVSHINAEFDENTWMDPDAWARSHLISGAFESTSGKCCKCSGDSELNTEQVETIAEDSASFIYLKKFVSMLFNRKNFNYDSNQQLYERSVTFTVQRFQMDKLERLQDPRDIDSILMEIFSNVRFPNMCRDGQQLFHAIDVTTGIKTTVFNILHNVWQLAKTTEIRFLLVVIIVILIALLINVRFKIGWVPLIFGGLFIYGYLHTYLECNRDIEVNEMLEMLNRNKGKEKSAQDSKLIRFFKGMFYSIDDEHQDIKKSAKLSLGFCRPDHVLIMYFNDIFIKYIQVLIEQCSVTLTTLNGALGFPYSLLSGLVFVYLIGHIIKLTFKYIFSPSAWSHYINRKQSYHPEQVSLKDTITQGDRISGDNLILLLNAINSANHRTLPSATDVSGVEDVIEAIEPSLEKSSQELNTTTVEKNNDNISSENSPDEKDYVKIKDLFEC